MNYVHNIVPWLLNMEYCVSHEKWVGPTPDSRGGMGRLSPGPLDHQHQWSGQTFYSLGPTGKIACVAGLSCSRFRRGTLMAVSSSSLDQKQYTAFLLIIWSLIPALSSMISILTAHHICWWFVVGDDEPTFCVSPREPGLVRAELSRGAQPRSVWHGMGSETQQTSASW